MRALERAITLLDGAAIAVARGSPAPSDRIESAEFTMGIRFPPSYREFLSTVGPIVIDRGNRITDRLTVSGLTGRDNGVLNVKWLYGLVRSRKGRAYLRVADEHRGTREPRYMYYSLDLLARHPKAGEYPVLAAPPGQTGVLVADDFGTWLEARLTETLPDAVQMWQSRLEFRTHSVTLGDAGEPYRAFVTTCECGWRSRILTIEADAQAAADRHSASPETMCAEAHWT
jgi:hypothetical protein